MNFSRNSISTQWSTSSNLESWIEQDKSENTPWLFVRGSIIVQLIFLLVFWIQLLWSRWICNIFTCLVESKPVSCTLKYFHLQRVLSGKIYIRSFVINVAKLLFENMSTHSESSNYVCSITIWNFQQRYLNLKVTEKMSKFYKLEWFKEQTFPNRNWPFFWKHN